MNEVIQLLKNHRSIRKYKSTPIPIEVLEEIVRAGQAASTSSNIQAYSVVLVTDPERKSKLAELSGNQRHIIESPAFLVWLADLNKIRLATGISEEEFKKKQNVELFLLGTIDATLAAQNAVVAAESLGYGVVYIGGIRNHPQEVSDLLELPPFVYPVFGLSVGVPDQEPDFRPRLPLSAVLHKEAYRQDGLEQDIQAYDEQAKKYYAARTGGAQETTWSKEMQRRFAENRLREHLHGYLLDRGFDLK